MNSFEYPALYDAASGLSGNSQSLFLRLIRAEYGLLAIAAIFSMEWSETSTYYIFYALVILISLAVALFRNFYKPEQDWYKGRALAESIKTSCWRYCMKAEPFSASDTDAKSRADFRNHLKAILKSNWHIGERIPSDTAANEQVTVSMETVRSLSLSERKAFYAENRIQEQRIWYARKSGANKKASWLWVCIAVSVYVVAIALALLRIAHPQWKHWPIDLLIVSASSIVGWTQVKKFNELSSSYALTAHEIGLTKAGLPDVSTEEEFSAFVNDAELAFSREHTQWVARQQSA